MEGHQPKKMKELENLISGHEKYLKELISFKAFCMEKVQPLLFSSAASSESSTSGSHNSTVSTVVPSSFSLHSSVASSNSFPCQSSVSYVSALKQGSFLTSGISSVANKESLSSFHWAKEHLSVTDGDSESDSGGFSDVVSKSARRSAKRLPSPLQSAFSKRSTTSANHPTSSNLSNKKMPISISENNSTRLIGTGPNSKLCGAGPRLPLPKSVFCVSNLLNNTSINDIKEHCRDNNIKVLFAFDVSNSNLSSKSFKIAIPSDQSTAILNSSLWPETVIIRPWISRGAPSKSLPVNEGAQILSKVPSGVNMGEAVLITSTEMTNNLPLVSPSSPLNSTVIDLCPDHLNVDQQCQDIVNSEMKDIDPDVTILTQPENNCDANSSIISDKCNSAAQNNGVEC